MKAEERLKKYLSSKYKECPYCGHKLRRKHGKSNRHGERHRLIKGKAK